MTYDAPSQWAWAKSLDSVEFCEFDGGAERAAEGAIRAQPDLKPAAQLLTGWRFADDPDLLGRFLNLLAENPPQTEHEAPVARIAAGLERLRSLGEQVEARRRAPWRAPVAVDAARDAAVERMWGQWVAGAPFEIADAWDSEFLGPLMRAYLGVVDAVGVSASVRGLVASELREGSFFVLAGSGEGVPGWRKVLARVVEAAPGGPFAPVFGALGDIERRRFTDGASQRTYARSTLALVFDAVADAQLRADLSGDRFAGPGCEQAIDLHVAKRLADIWRETSPGGDVDWNVITQNRGRIRTRLRALLAEGPVENCWPLAQTAGLHARTRAAVMRYGRAWAQSRRAYGFRPSSDGEVDVPCSVAPDARPAVDKQALHALTCWVLGVTVSGHLPRLERWVFAGGAGDKHASFGRWLTWTPGALKAPGRAGDRSGYRHLRAVLGRDFAGWLAVIEPTVERVAAIDPGRADRAAAIVAALGQWHGAVHRPSGRRDNIHHARDALAWIRARRAR